MDELQKSFFIHFFLACSLIIIHTICAATDTISSAQTIQDGETMVSSSGIFELGFFSPGSSGNWYLGIWYKNTTIKTVVWVANRESPLRNKSGVLKVTEVGNLVILNDTNGIIVWSSNRSRPSLENPVAQLLDSGNLVVNDGNDNRLENFLWQSFDYLSDTYITGMSLGWNFVTGIETYTSSWKSNDNPAQGEFTLHLDPTGYPQLLLKRGSTLQNRLGPWNGLDFSNHKVSNNLTVTINKTDVKYRVDINDRPVSRSTISPNGVVQCWNWNDQTQSWSAFVNIPADDCDSYKLCGAYGNCNIGNSPSCGCLDYRFVPKDPEAWNRADWSSGCIRRTNLSCGGDVFLKYSGIKLPDSRNSWFNVSMKLEECKAECLRNCSCTAYTQLDVRQGGSGCLFYSGDLVDIRVTSPGGQEIYIRLASSELESKGKKRVTVIASITSMAGMVLLCLTLFLCIWKRKKDQHTRRKGLYNGSHDIDSQLPFFKLSRILKATDHFSIKNKLGQGGFGPVYKGILDDGEEIAVKCLSKTLAQGVEE